jgi:hypothetical protein
MRRMPAAVRYLTLHRLAFAITALTVIVTAICASAAAAFAASVVTVANRDTLARNPASSILLTADTTQLASSTAEVTSAIRRSSAGLPMSFLTASQSDPLDLPAPVAGPKAQTVLMNIDQFRRHARLVSGNWPAGQAGGSVQACLPATAAALLRMSPGRAITVRDSLGGPSARIFVACTFTERRPASTYWQLNQIGPSGVSRSGGFSVYGPLVTTRPAASWPVPATAGAWLADPDFGAMTAPNLGILGDSLQSTLNRLANSQALGAVVTTGLPALLESQAIALEVARSQLLIGELILLVMAGATLAVAVRLLASQRAGQPGLLRARGATRRQLAARGGTDAVLLAVPAAIVGPLAGAWLAPAVARLGLAGSASLRLPSSLPLPAWLAGIAVSAGCAVVIMLPWLREPPSPIAQRSMTARRKTVAAAVSNGADVALILLAVGAAWQLAHYATPVSTGLSGTIGVDPILVAAPVLALSAGTLVMLRLLPFLVRLAERAASRGRGITVPAAAWLISRRTLRQAGPALLTVLAVATAVIALGETASWQRSVHDQANFTVGADTRINMPESGELPVDQVASVTSARGVTAATPVIREPFALQASNTSATLLAINSPQAEKIVPLRTDLAIRPARDPLAVISMPQPVAGVRLPGHPVQLQLEVSLTGAGRNRYPTTGVSDATLGVQLADASGVAYQLGNAPLVPDGAIHEIVITIAAGQGADYPLTLTGFTLNYTMPQNLPGQVATLTIHSVSAGDPAAGQPFSRLPSAVSAGRQDAIVSGTPMSPVGSLASGQPSLISYVRSGAGVSASFRIGAGSESGSGDGQYLGGFQAGYGTVTITPRMPSAPCAGQPTQRARGGRAGSAQAARRRSVPTSTALCAAPLPGIATQAFLAASGLKLGEVVQVDAQQVPVQVRLVGEVAQFPTITTPGGGVIVNQAQLQELEQANGTGALPVTEWWLRQSGRPAFAGLPPGTTVTSLAAVTSSLSSQPLGVAPLAALVAVAAVALLLAAAGFLVSVASSAERGRDLAVLDALGATPGQLTRLRCLEQAMLSAPAAAGGLALGLLLSRLIIPAVTITAQATQPVPPVLVLVPLLPALAVAALIAAVPVAAVAISMLRGTATMARLRAEEET